MAVEMLLILDDARYLQLHAPRSRHLDAPRTGAFGTYGIQSQQVLTVIRCVTVPPQVKPREWMVAM